MNNRGNCALYALGVIGFIALIAAVGAIGLGLRALLLPHRAIDRTIGTAEGIIDKTLTADNAIYNYEWFKQKEESIRALEDKIEIAQYSYDSFIEAAGPRENWTFEDKNEAARLASIKQGLQSQYKDVVADYNAKSKMANRAIFKDGLIPDFIEVGAGFLR